MRISRLFGFGIVVLAWGSFVAGCAPAQTAAPTTWPQPSAEQTKTGDSLPASLDGLAFVQGGRLMRVSGGIATEIARDGRTKTGVVSAVGSNALLVTEDDGSGARVVVVQGAGIEGMKTVLRIADASTLLGVRLGRGRLYQAVQGDPSALLVSSAIARPSKLATVVLGASFSGEFDIDGIGGVVFTGATQGPATLYARGGSGVRVLTAKLATAFTPAVSRTGDLACVTGTQRAGEPIALWVLDRKTRALHRLAATSGLVPAHPVISADGSRIAFRSGADGSLHVIRLDGTDLRKLPFSADDTTIAW